MSERQVKLNGNLRCSVLAPDTSDETDASDFKLIPCEGEIRRVDSLSELIGDYDTAQFRSLKQ